MHQSDNDWIEILRNISRERKVWVHLGKILRWEGGDNQMLTMFYRSAIKAVIFLVSSCVPCRRR